MDTNTDPQEVERVEYDPSLDEIIVRMGSMQKKVAQLRAADMTKKEIARTLDITEQTVNNYLQQPNVRRMVLKLAAFTSEDLRPKIAEVNSYLAENAMEAAEAEVDVLRFTRRFMYKEAAEVKMDTRLKAADLCARTAQDMQDRAGAHAPKQVQVKSLNVDISGEQAATIMTALKELDQVEQMEYIPQIVGAKEPIEEE